MAIRKKTRRKIITQWIKTYKVCQMYHIDTKNLVAVRGCLAINSSS